METEKVAGHGLENEWLIEEGEDEGCFCRMTSEEGAEAQAAVMVLIILTGRKRVNGLTVLSAEQT